MATKSYKLRFELRGRKQIVDPDRFGSRAEEVGAVQRWLDDTREAFNAGVDYLTGWLLRMHRGAGVCREKKDGIWREWEEIGTLDKLKEARQRHQADPGTFALLENHNLLNAFKGKGRCEAEAVQLAECCRRIIGEIAPPATEGEQTQMNRSDLDLLTLADSEARGVRPKSAAKDGSEKKTSGKRPGWMLDKAICEECARSPSLADLIQRLENREEFQSAKQDGKKKIDALSRKHRGSAWPDAQCAIMEPHTDGRTKWEVARQKWEDKRRSSEESGAVSAYKALLDADCLPLPGLSRPSDCLKLSGHVSEWNYALWNMAGQRVRSHIGWSRRRANERTIWELRTALFNRGGWVRTKRKGKTVSKDRLEKAVADGEFKPEEYIRFDAPSADQAADFEQRPAYADRKWVKTLSQYESVEMPKHLEGVAFGAADQPRILRRTAKGWGKVRQKWIDVIKKASKADEDVALACDLLEVFDQMRTRKTRDFGDRRLFEWLAAPNRRWLWDGNDHDGDDNDCGRDDRDCVSAFATHNEHLADKPESITFTRTDPVKHPVWPFFGENSAVEYGLAREPLADGTTRLVLRLRQLLSKESDGSYTAVDNVKIGLLGYEDFEKSFAFPTGEAEVSATQKLVFQDDLLGESSREGSLSGIKLTWERDELESHQRKRNPRKAASRVYASFSCDAGDAELPVWLTNCVGSNVKLKKPRDGMTRVFWLKKAIRKDSPDDEGGSALGPGERAWPIEAIENGFAVRGTDLGYRTSSAGAWWRLAFEKPQSKIAWPVGKCGNKDVYAVLERTASVSLPGDGEALPPAEQGLRDRLYSLRTRLNLNNAVLRIVRLLTLEAVKQRKPDGDKLRKRSDGSTKRIGTKWRVETTTLDPAEIRENCRKAAEQLFRWASTDAMSESLKAIGFNATLFWDWLAARDPKLDRLSDVLPKTEVPTEKHAKKGGIDRDPLKTRREKEDAEFAQAVCDLRVPLAEALCDGHDPARRLRARSGLWAEFDRAILREISYSNRGDAPGKIERLDQGLFRLLRKPPVTKHQDRKDEANNLPHGQTYRGGVSMQRLNFLDDVKNFVRRWSCRPRWPGDIRRVPEDARFDRCDTEHLDHLREHRAKLIAHADIAQALGFEQDLRRGLWRFRDTFTGELLWHRPERRHLYQWKAEKLVQTAEGAPSHPVPAHEPAHVNVYEDLSRYRMSSDRPKNENAGLARWSHRQILSFAQHIGGLFGVPVATVDARFSSRYCSHCGAPGCRAVRFDPAWLNQDWMQNVLKSNDIRDAAMKSIANRVREVVAGNTRAYDRVVDRPWVLRDGGEYFVCANDRCDTHRTPINADHNAAANVGLRFLRGVDGIRVTTSERGVVTKSIGFVPSGLKLVRSNVEDELHWHPCGSDSAPAPRKNRRESDDASATEAMTIADEDESGGALTLFRDPSGTFRCRDHWFEGKVFWGAVARSCAAAISATNASRFGTESDEADD